MIAPVEGKTHAISPVTPQQVLKLATTPAMGFKLASNWAFLMQVKLKLARVPV